ncbi:Coenzyme F420 hydrogenase/dehydrogenase, beta subunit C-terminal domain [Desulfosporosinus sp. FKA]|uniref:Coenzyme F420 hydrogenase/dehydrogenase, beta subunit C-terminal domain n=1 Tax=Desulfosporosinus sp. FKA TaxID=1969834 RepID=UPI000B4A19CA|nr:Coenzyme F420 hydrogenase/dehydrogenase, beta subunit C-terminal domain [Desulfosporosinus sp. FKA]
MHISMKSSDQCSGCSACKVVCPSKAIEFFPDEEGFLIPSVLVSKCIDCGLCVRTCPALNLYQSSGTGHEDKAYAAMWKHDERNNSASGAFFPALAKFFLEEKHGYVCGCVLDHLVPKHIVSNNWNDVLRMQDSKYVQSDMRNCIRETISLLKNDQYVLFSGTSCQVSGLASVLQKERISTEKLFTVDFFCHGVPSPKVWNDYLIFYESQTHRKVYGYRFRSKKYGWGTQARGSSHLNTLFYQKGTRQDNFSWVSRMWRSVFFSNLCIRRYCHTCPYATPAKPSDITMGDFWGVDKILPDFDDGKGCSAIILHSLKAKEVICKIDYLIKEEVCIDQIIEKQANAFKPSDPGDKRDEFWQDYNLGGFPLVASKYFFYTSKNRIRFYMHRILFALHIKDIY